MFVEKEMEIRDQAKWVKIKPSCGKDNYGHWWCVECCKVAGYNNFGAMSHDSSYPKHHIVWHCGEHGFETK